MRLKWHIVAATLLAAALLLVWAPAGAEAHPSSFKDMSETQYPEHHNAIEYMAAANVVCGYNNGTFKPWDPILRGQAAKILVGWRQVATVANGPSFKDLDATYRSYVVTVAAKGWITGYSDKTFRPYKPLTRENMAQAMVRALDWKASLTSAEIAQILSAFPDAAKVTSSARAEVALAVQKGLFKGTGDGRLDPQGTLTRAQFCLVAYRVELGLRTQVTKIDVLKDFNDDNKGARTRVILNLSREPGAVKSFVTRAGLYIDIGGGIIDGTLSATISTSEAKSLSLQQRTTAARTIRASVALGTTQRWQVTTLAPSGGAGHRIVVDIYPGPPLICIDAGHGGKDPGAIGVNGTREKTVNLAIALKARDALKDAGLPVVMTRVDDTYPTLQGRCDTANQAGAMVFVSIHNNSISTSSTTGTETFYQGNPEVDADGKLLAQAIQKNLVSALGTKNRGARVWSTKGELYVLRNTNMPASLTEVGFLSNSTEEAKLNSADYQTKAAKAIAKGITEYLKWSPAAQ